MEFETEYQLGEFRKIESEYFDNGKYYDGLIRTSHKYIVEQMLKLINQLETQIKNDNSNSI
jgi:hypothetical protein